MSTLRRLRDPQLLLFLSTVMEQAAFATLCRHLRCVPAGQDLLPLEVLVALEQVRRSLLVLQ